MLIMNLAITGLRGIYQVGHKKEGNMATRTQTKERTKVYEVRPDPTKGGWRVVSENTCLKRASRKEDAILEGRERARRRATDPDWGSNSELRVFNLDGGLSEHCSYRYIFTS